MSRQDFQREKVAYVRVQYKDVAGDTPLPDVQDILRFILDPLSAPGSRLSYLHASDLDLSAIRVTDAKIYAAIGALPRDS